MSGASATFGLLFTGDETYTVIKHLKRAQIGWANLKRMQIGRAASQRRRPGCVVRAARWGPLVSAGGAERRAGMLFFLLVGVWL